MGIGYGPTITEYISDVDTDQYGRILVGGAFRLFDGQPENAFVRLRPEGLLSTPTFEDGQPIVVYPNPATDTMHVSVRGEQPADSVIIYSLSGIVVATGSGNSIDVSSLAAGLYMVKITAGSDVGHFRLVKR